jgi:hypothetical protein
LQVQLTHPRPHISFGGDVCDLYDVTAFDVVVDRAALVDPATDID